MKNFTTVFIGILISIQGYSQFIEQFIWDTISFEEPYEYLSIDTSSQNIWQIGAPNKVFFESAYSPNNAIVTDTINFYPINNHSFFDIKLSSANNPDYGWVVFLEITHKYDTDESLDGGYISVSYDYGETWYNIINDDSWNYEIYPNPWDGTNTNLYSEEDVLYNGEYGFSGNSGDWITTEFGWYYLPVGPPGITTMLEDTTIIRFNFISDSVETNKEGWMIDHIRMISYSIMGSVEDYQRVDFSISPNPIRESAQLEFDKYYQNIHLQVFSLSGQLIREQDYFNTQSIQFDRNKIKEGSYLLKLTLDQNEFGIKKIVIQ